MAESCPENYEGYLTVKEAAHELNCTERTVWNYLKDKKLTSTKDGKKVLIPKADLEKLKAPSQAPGYDSESQIIVDRKHYESMVHQLTEMGFRLGQLETEKRFLTEKVLLLEAPKRSPWYKRIFGK